MVNTITNQGFHMVSLYNEVCIELSLQQTEFSDIISVFTHVDIYTVLDSGGGHLVSTHFEGQCIISAPKDTMDHVAIVMLLCIQRVILQLHHRMMFITPLDQVAYHKEHNHHDHTPIFRTIASNTKKKNSDNLKIQISKKLCILDLLTIIFTFLSPIFTENKENQECVAEEEPELLGKGGNKREKKNSDNKSCDDDTNKTFSEDTLSILFPSLEIRRQEIVAYPATQQPVLEPILNKFSVPERAPSKHDTMAVEFLRLCTMHDYPNTNGPSLLRLAQAGFFYEGNGNELVCFSCDFRKGSWNYNDSPREIHLRMSPNCKFLSQGGDGNVPVPRGESTQDLVPLQSAPPAGVVEPDGPRTSYNASTSNNTAHLASANYSDGQDQPDTTRRTMVVKHPEYASRPARLASYANFPRHMKQHPADMTDAGFYYAGFGDCCRCYHCGIGKKLKCVC
ncbi:uncharacterized protein LOC134242390 [Saccostrea cucullata]|uniref:uncharacterized protein LOC134242390 n=1 Tax=Saccostrea cuccullata TaxID=36930 RepID=UPI002ED632AB